jgi:poly(A) polymerase
MSSPETRRLMQALTEGGAAARFVGGCVRDAWLQRPVKDVDIATPLPPDEVLGRLKAAGLGAVATGLAHGTVTALVNRRPYEITTLRRDLETDGRHARVEFTDDWEADAQRRDLTINALFCDTKGAVWDYVGGAADLAAGRVRFVGEARRRIEEDYLRLLRFFRFHAHYGKGEPDAEGLAASLALAPELARISAERKRDELLKLLAAPDPVPVLRIMREGGVLAEVLPEAGEAEIARLERLLAMLPEAPPLLRLAALLPEGSVAAAETARRLRLSNDDRDRLVFLRDGATGAPLIAERLAWRRTLQRQGNGAVLARLLLIDTDLAFLGAAKAEASAWTPKPMPLQGADLVAAGFAPGPALGEILRQVEDWWLLEDRRPDRTACLAKAQELAG